ncbi:uncharacterized protein EDB93DRAFT_882820 [Suillus bovinus]|uniref:uncharacterized protein n=1 Tax=Suillus bovinus TaxID=48563 RepID=UPI001B86E755|nr:uncharacterized protein EDB93DRAFT_882820 [Suillus bovinus]KAG2133526.1 hypothetical protein EDB93DRAFT_882820 [Suillus bovinus]
MTSIEQQLPPTMSNIDLDSVEEQLQKLPEDWKPPLGTRAQRTFAFLCTLILNQPNLEKLWQEAREEMGWEEYNDRIYRDAMRLFVAQMMVFYASIVCVTTPPPGVQHFDATSVTYCLVLLRVSSIISAIGLLFLNRFFKSSLTIIETDKVVRKISNHAAVIDPNDAQDKKPFGLGRYDVLYHIGMFRMSQLCFAYTLASTVGALSIIALGANLINVLTGVVALGTFVDHFFMQNRVKSLDSLFFCAWFSIFAYNRFSTLA